MKTKVTPITTARSELGLNGGFEVRFPLGIVLQFYGSPFRKAGMVDDAFTVKCASEQPGPADVVIPCEDFGVPTHADMLRGVDRAINAAFDGEPVFAGCAGGIGRTGTFLSVVIKALNVDPTPYNKTGKSKVGYVNMIRAIYLGHAVETAKQEQLIDTIEVSDIRKTIGRLWRRAVLRKYLPFLYR